MKCPACQRRVRRGKEGMTCPKCGYRFYLDPQRPAHGNATDNQLLAAAQRASDRDTYAFTPNQLYGALFLLRRHKHQWQMASILVVLTLIAVAALLLSDIPYSLPGLVPAALGGLLVVLVVRSMIVGPPMPSFEQTMKAAARMAAFEPMEKLVTQNLLTEPPPTWPEPDLYDYGVERLLIVERDLLVDLLVFNNFHAEQRTLVIAESGYPAYLLPLAQRALEERADLPVFLLHDAEREDGAMLARLHGPDSPFPIRDHPVTDLGLSERDIRQRHWLRRAARKGAWERAPIDLVPYPRLGPALGAALVSGMSLAAMSDSGAEWAVVLEFG